MVVFGLAAGLLEILRYQLSLKADPIIAFAVARRAWIYSTTNR